MKRIGMVVAGLAACWGSLVRADVTLVYETTLADGSKTQHSIAISGRWLRLDAEPAGAHSYMLMDAGYLRFYYVDDTARRYTVVEAGPTFNPTAPPPPHLHATKATREVADLHCRVVEEATDAGAVAEHCMVATGPLRLSAREMTSLSRLFAAARRMDFGWAGVATTDERMVSVQSRSLGSAAAQELKSVSHAVVSHARLRVPKDYQRVVATKPAPAGQPTASAPEPAALPAGPTAHAAESGKQGGGAPHEVEPEHEAEPEHEPAQH